MAFCTVFTLLLRIVRVADREAAVVADLIAEAAQDLDADRVEGARADLGRLFGILSEDRADAGLDLARGLVREGDRHDLPRRGRIHGKARQILAELFMRKIPGTLQLLDRLLRDVRRNKLRVYGVAVADNMGKAVDEDGGLAAPRACQDQKGAVHLIDGFPLLIVQFFVILVKQRSLLGEIRFPQLHSGHEKTLASVKCAGISRKRQ